MSQQLNPINGGVTPTVQTSTPSTSSLNVLSPQYTKVFNLESRPTEWVPDGRPIYRRLPGTSETYQIDFFNVVNESNVSSLSSANKRLEEVGYVYIPYGAGINGPSSCQVIASETGRDLLLKAGNVVWKYGKTSIIPTILNLEVLGVLSGKYDLGYQLVYDDSPIPLLYDVSDFALTGIPLNITASTDSVIGWRYPAVNAFLNKQGTFWSNRDTLFPSYADPSFGTGYVPYIQWVSQQTHSFKSITFRCPPNTVFTGTATLSYVVGTELITVMSTSIQSDSVGQYYTFNIEDPVFRTGWNVSFSDPTVSIQSTTVTGTLTLLEKPDGPSPKAALVMYPAGTAPKTIKNSAGETVPATYCFLAQVDTSADFKVIKIEDTRDIIHRDFVPVADWLTLPFDRTLTDLYSQVDDYAPLWMAPTSSMKFEYADLEADQITVIP